MKTQKWFKVFSSIIVLAMVLSLGMAQNTASAQSTSNKPAIADNSSIHGAISSDELPYLKLKSDGTVDVMIQMSNATTSEVYAQSIASGNETASASESAISAFSQIQESQSQVISSMATAGIGETVLYQVHAAYNGVAVNVKYDQLAAIRSMPGVKAVHVLVSKTMDNSQTVPFIGASAVWETGISNRGEGITVGVIDTGIDYLHTDFGGPGFGYSADFTKLTPYTGFPSSKVVGGYDFAGDAYNADSGTTPTPDPNPMDCNGHGTHVAGTIAGYGVNSNGTTYHSSYNESTNFSSLRVGPGVAPLASLYALRVFGCTGSTNLVTEAIDWAMDPNGDGDTSDHLDVINMSLGSEYGYADEPDAVAADNAAKAGVIVVTAAGNASDTHYVVGSPSVATRAISVAASVGNVKYAGFVVTNPSSLATTYQATPGDPSNVTDPGISNIQLKLAPTNDTEKLFDGNTYTDAFGCNPAPTSNYYANQIAFVARGSCPFYTKALNAQNAGAVGIIVYNYIAYATANYDEAVTMDMTGTSGTITIPNMQITNASGQPIADALKASTPVYGTIAFSTRYTPAVSPADTLSSFSSRGSRMVDSFLKPDISAPGSSIVSAAALTGNQGAFMDGTSMATPAVSGVMALLRELHPTWSVEELKALAMNTATHDLTTDPEGTGDTYTPAREGAGRVDVANAAQSMVVAFNAVDTGAVSVSFGEASVPADQTDFTLTKAFKVENKSGSRHGSPASYSISYVPASSWAVAGVSFSVVDGAGNPVSTITVDPNKEQDLFVKMTVDGTQLTHVMDATMSTSQTIYDGSSTYPLSRSYETETGGYILFTPNTPEAGVDDQELRLPVYAVVRPVSAMKSSGSLAMPFNAGSNEIVLSGTGIDTGSNYPTDITSLVSAYELKYTGVDEGLPANAASGNIHYVGVMSDVYGHSGDLSKSELYFAVATYGKWTIPSSADTQVEVYIDTNGDGNPEYILFNDVLPDSSGLNGTDVFVSTLYDIGANKYHTEDYLDGVSGQSLDFNIYNTNVMVLPVLAGDLGLSNAASTINFWVGTYTATYGLVDEVGGTDGFTYDGLHLAVDTTGGYTGTPFWSDLPGSTIPVTYNYAYASADGIQGILLLHHHNDLADSAEVVLPLHHALFFPPIKVPAH